jgi:Zn-dependent protease
MDLLSGAVRIGQVWGITIRVHVWFLIWMGYSLLSAGDAWRTELWFMGMLFGIVLLHEFGHCFGARSVGGDARDILLWPLGGLAYAHAPMTPWAQFVTVACGPLVNLVFCLASAAVLIGTTGHWGVVSWNPFIGPRFGLLDAEWQAYVALFFRVNQIMLAFNLLPVYPLDGGQLFQTILWPFMGLQRSLTTACIIGLMGAGWLAYMGISGGGFMLVAIAIFGGMTCWQRLQAARMGYVVDERIATYDYVGRAHRRRGFWSRLFGRRRRADAAGFDAPGERYSPNPNPGAWEERLGEARALEEQLDRILKKVHEQGIHSLSYTERQLLERATRERQRREQELGRR